MNTGPQYNFNFNLKSFYCIVMVFICLDLIPKYTSTTFVSSDFGFGCKEHLLLGSVFYGTFMVFYGTFMYYRLLQANTG